MKRRKKNSFTPYQKKNEKASSNNPYHDFMVDNVYSLREYMVKELIKLWQNIKLKRKILAYKEKLKGDIEKKDQTELSK